MNNYPVFGFILGILVILIAVVVICHVWIIFMSLFFIKPKEENTHSRYTNDGFIAGASISPRDEPVTEFNSNSSLTDW